jgi:uncharacterized protein (UPF0332 family)
MTQAEKKIEWCLRKAERELQEGSKHRGLVKINPDVEKSREHIKKAEHYLQATDYLKKGGFSDISASTIFYSMYHCLLAIAKKFGFESRNQECTFALMFNLIEENKITLKKELLEKIASLNVEDSLENTSIEIREQYQYGTQLSLNDNLYNELVKLAKEVLLQAKEEIEK